LKLLGLAVREVGLAHTVVGLVVEEEAHLRGPVSLLMLYQQR